LPAIRLLEDKQILLEAGTTAASGFTVRVLAELENALVIEGDGIKDTALGIDQVLSRNGHPEPLGKLTAEYFLSAHFSSHPKAHGV
jgi:hypothetical protein